MSFGDPNTPPPPPPSGGPSPSKPGFFAALFDFNFNTFITPMIVKAVYIVFTVLIALGWIGWLIAGFATSVGYGFVALIIGPIVALLYLALFRMTLEFYVALVRMSDDIHQRGLG